MEWSHQHIFTFTVISFIDRNSENTLSVPPLDRLIFNGGTGLNRSAEPARRPPPITGRGEAGAAAAASEKENSGRAGAEREIGLFRNCITVMCNATMGR